MLSRADNLTFRLDALTAYIERHGPGSHPLNLAIGIARSAVEEIERLKEGIEDIADRLDGWTDHDGIGPENALRALLNPEGSNEDA